MCYTAEHLGYKVHNCAVDLESGYFYCIYGQVVLKPACDHVYGIFDLLKTVSFLQCPFSISFLFSPGLCTIGGSAVTLYLLSLSW